MSARLLGLGTATPAGRFHQADAERLAELLCADERGRRRLRLLHARSRIHSRGTVLLDPEAEDPIGEQTFLEAQRDAEDRGPGTAERMAVYEREAPPLAARAAGRALQDAAVEPAEITQVVVVTCTGFFAPGLDARLVTDLGLSPTVGRTQVGFQGCHGALNGLRVADALVAADPGARVLLTAVELSSIHVSHGFDARLSVGNALFADGAAALVLGAGDADDPDAAGAEAGADADSQAKDERLRLVAQGSLLLAEYPESLEWRIGDHGFEMSLSPELPKQIQTHLRGWVEEWLARSGLARDEVGSWAVHPGGPRILDAVESALELEADALAASRTVLREHGNMSSPTLLFILERLRREAAPRPIVALGFGPGLTIEAALFG